MQLLNRPEDPEAFNSNLASAEKRSKLPDWFPHPYPGYENLKVYVSSSNLKPKKAAQPAIFSISRPELSGGQIFVQ